MKLNELVCPTCGLKCLTDTSCVTCDSCQTYFHANQSRSVDCPVPVLQPIQITPGITPIQIIPQPVQYPYFTWHGASICGTGEVEYTVWN